MKGFQISAIALMILLNLLYSSCQKAPVNRDSNIRPARIVFAIAGEDQLVILPADSATLDGSGSYSNGGKIVSYHWQEIEGTGRYDLIEPDSRKAIVRNLERGMYKFILTVADVEGRSANDTLLVFVDKPAVTEYGRILEHGTDKPIEGVEVFLSVCLTPGGINYCKLKDTILHSDEHGRFSFPQYGFLFTDAYLPGYFGSSFGFIAESFPVDPEFNFEPLNFCDSFIVWLIPKTTITVHVKDSSGAIYGRDDGGSENYLVLQARAKTLAKKDALDNSSYPKTMYLRHFIDTSFQYEVFGDLDNAFIVKSYSNNYLPDSTLFEQIMYIGTGTPLNLNITY